MNVQTVAERHSETLEDIAKFFAGLGLKPTQTHRAASITLSWPKVPETLQ